MLCPNLDIKVKVFLTLPCWRLPRTHTVWRRSLWRTVCVVMTPLIHWHLRSQTCPLPVSTRLSYFGMYLERGTLWVCLKLWNIYPYIIDTKDRRTCFTGPLHCRATGHLWKRFQNQVSIADCLLQQFSLILLNDTVQID